MPADTLGPQTTGIARWLAATARRLAGRLDPAFRQAEARRQRITTARVYRRGSAGQASAGSMRSVADAAFAASPGLAAVMVIERAGIGTVDVVPIGTGGGSAVAEALDAARPFGVRLEYVEAVDD
jgi:hypothetical protein